MSIWSPKLPNLTTGNTNNTLQYPVKKVENKSERVVRYALPLLHPVQSDLRRAAVPFQPL